MSETIHGLYYGDNLPVMREYIKDESVDLVYLDPPYAREDEKMPKDYHELYHFLNGMVDYDNWNKNINLNTKNKRLFKQKNHWNEGKIENNFDALFKKFKDFNKKGV